MSFENGSDFTQKNLNTIEASVALKNGIPRLFVDGEIIAPNILMPIRGPQPEIFESQIRRAAKHQQHLLSIVPIEDSVDRTIEVVLKCNPDALILMRIAYFIDMRQLGCSGHNFVDQYGIEHNFYSYASDRWYNYTANEIRKFIQEVLNHPIASKRVIGYHIGGGSCGEWLGPYFWEGLTDCSPVNTEKFRLYLKEKYSDEEALNKAWGSKDLKFQNVEVPKKLPGSDCGKPGEMYVKYDETILKSPENMMHIDYLDYFNNLVVQRMDGLGEIIKQETENRNVVAMFYGYHTEARMPTSGHFALSALLKSKNIDIICSPVSYDDRNEGGKGASMTPCAAITAAGKIWMDEADYRSPVRKAEGHSEVAGGLDTGGYCKTPEGLIEVLRRQAGKNMAGAGASWWFDMVGRGWFDFDEFWQECQSLYGWYSAYIKLQQNQSPDVVFITDEAACIAHGDPWQFGSVTGLSMREPIHTCGLSWGWYLTNDILDGHIPDSKLIVLQNPYRMSECTANKLMEALNGKMVVVMGLPGRTDKEIFSKFCGMDIQEHLRGDSDLTIEENQKIIDGFNGNIAGLKDVCRALVSDEKAKVLGRYSDGAAAAAINEESKTIFCGGALLTSEQLRALGRYAGGHVYCDSGDVSFASYGLFVIHTRTQGNKLIKFPEKCDVFDAVKNRWHNNVSEIEENIPKNVTRLYFYGDKNQMKSCGFNGDN